MDPFIPIKNPEILMDIIVSRLPYSSNMYNIVKMHKRFEGIINFYTLFEDLTENCLILSTTLKDDTGIDINVCGPKNIKWTQEIEEAFKTTKVINWNQSYCFASLDKNISKHLVKLINSLGNEIEVYPCFYYLMDKDEAKNLELQELKSKEMEIKSLEGELGVNFIMDTWVDSGTLRKTDLIRKMIERNESSALYIPKIMGNRPISGIILGTNGLIGMLYTIKEYRNKGYANLCTKDLIRKLGENGFHICSAVDFDNMPSKSFHEKTLELKISHEVDYLIYNVN